MLFDLRLLVRDFDNIWVYSLIEISGSEILADFDLRL